MARIRSVHPGQWTDDEFLECSPLARLLALALRNEADDQGLFEWKPVAIKRKLLPADNTNIDALLTELERYNLIASFEHAGRKYGAIRNFMDYQRPKKPNCVHFMPPEFRTYVASKTKGAEPEKPDKGSGSPKVGNGSAEEGGRREGKEEEPPSEGACAPVAASPDKELFDRGKQVLGANAGGLIKRLKDHCGIEQATKHLEDAAGKSDPREWVGAILRDPDAKEDAEHEAWREDYFRGVL